MQHAPTRRALAGSVLVLGSAGTVSAVHLDSAQLPAGPDGGAPAAMAPPALPDAWPTILGPQTPSVEESTISAPSPGDRTSTRSSSATSDRPVSTGDLIDMANGPRGRESVVVPFHDVEKTVPLRLTPGIGHRAGVLGSGRNTLDDVTDQDDVYTRAQGQRVLVSRGLTQALNVDHDRAYYGRTGSSSDRTEHRYSDYGYRRSGAGYHRADMSHEATNVSHVRSRCGRHRA